MKSQVRTIFVCTLVIMVLSVLIVHSVPSDGIYINGNTGEILHYSGGNVDWQMPIEGNYSTWAFAWMTVSVKDAIIVRAFEGSDLLLLLDTYNFKVCWVGLSNGTVISTTNLINGLYGGDFSATMFKYVAYVINDTRTPTLKIYKLGTQVQSTNLTSTVGWLTTGVYYTVAFSSDGKYLVVSNYGTTETALFIGS